MVPTHISPELWKPHVGGAAAVLPVLTGLHTWRHARQISRSNTMSSLSKATPVWDEWLWLWSGNVRSTVATNCGKKLHTTPLSIHCLDLGEAVTQSLSMDHLRRGKEREKVLDSGKRRAGRQQCWHRFRTLYETSSDTIIHSLPVALPFFPHET